MAVKNGQLCKEEGGVWTVSMTVNYVKNDSVKISETVGKDIISEY